MEMQMTQSLSLIKPGPCALEELRDETHVYIGNLRANARGACNTVALRELNVFNKVMEIARSEVQIKRTRADLRDLELAHFL